VSTPLVSVVIPTRNRPALVGRAVASVLNQSFTGFEVIVVVDGPDAETIETLAAISDPRVRVIALQENVGGAEARNVGARNASGNWIALLDDDDEWLPEKLQTQLAAADKLKSPYALVASRFIDRNLKGDLVRPVAFPLAGQPISEFLFCEVSPLGGITGFAQTSTWLVSRLLLLETPFTRGQRTLQDLDWLLRGVARPDCEIAFIPEPLSIFHNEHAGRDRVTKKVDWQYSYHWALANRSLFTPKALAFFLVVFCINPAARQQVGWPTTRSIWADCRRFGVITPKLRGLLFLYTFIYPAIRSIFHPNALSAALYRLRTLWAPVR
jgi:glycosyltransferase involved in cell wall biosynthesis